MNVLAIAPHPDDEALGCGGSLYLHSQRGDRVIAVFLTSGEMGLKHLSREKAWRTREQEAQRAAKVLRVTKLAFLRCPDWFVGDAIKDTAKALQPILKAEEPQLIYVPHANEWHPDHKAALPVLRLALKGSRVRAPEIRAYEVWTPLTEYDHVEDITAVMPRKLRALRTHRSQCNEFDYERAVRGLNEFRGALAAKCRYAEVFQSIDLKARK